MFVEKMHIMIVHCNCYWGTFVKKLPAKQVYPIVNFEVQVIFQNMYVHKVVQV